MLSALREKGILIRHFSQTEITDYLRITIGTDDEMDIFIKTCGEILSK